MAMKTVTTAMVIMLLAPPPTVQGQHVFSKAAVATDAGPCSDIGRDILKKGGSAVDATIAAFLCVGLINIHSMGLGGGVTFAIYDSKTGKVETIEAKETAPSGVTQDMYLGKENLRAKGGLAVAVPAELRGYELAHKRHGKLPWKDLFQPSIRLAEEGFPLGRALGDTLSRFSDVVINSPSLCEVFCGKDGDVLKENDTIVFTKLAQTYRKIAEEGAGAFYQGELGQNFIADVQAEGGVMTMEDLRDYRAVLDENPLRIKVGEYEMVVPNAPAGGPLMTFIFNILNGFNLTTDSVASTDKKILTYHRILETFRLTQAWRSELGDPMFVNITQIINDLTSSSFGDLMRARITDHTTHPIEYYRQQYKSSSDHGTSHISVYTEDGSAVSATSTINLPFGAKFMSRSTGIIPNNKMSVFHLPGVDNNGHPASLKLFVEPGKRPFSSSCPVIIFDKSNKVKMVIGASGARRIHSAVTQVILNTLFFNYTLEEAMALPRLHDDLTEAGAKVEPNFDQNILDGLAAKKHKYSYYSPIGVVQVVVRQEDGIHAQSDFRKFSYAAGY